MASFHLCSPEDGMQLSEGEEPIVDEENLFFIDTSAMIAWQIPTTQYITAVEQSDALGASPNSELDDEPPYDPDADYSQRGTKQCFNCMSTSHIVSDCPYKRDPQHISLARADYGSRGGNTSRPVRFHEAEDMYKQRMEFNQIFEPGFVRGGLLRQCLGLNEDYNGGNEDLPWYFAMCDWGYPPGWVSDVDPRMKVVERINSTSKYEKADSVPLLFIYEDEGPGSPILESSSLDNGSGKPSDSISCMTGERSAETIPGTDSDMAESPALAPKTTLADPPTVAVSAQASLSSPTPIPPPPPFLVDEPPPPPDFPPPPDSPAPPSPPPPDSLPFPPRRWAHYRTTLFQSERLPISLVSRPLPALTDIPPPPPSSAAPLLPPSPPPLPSDPPPPPPSSLTEQEKRRLLWEQIVAAQSNS